MSRNPFTKHSSFLSILIRPGLVLMLLAGMLVAVPAATAEAGEPVGADSGAPTPPAGLSSTDWATMQELMRQAEYFPTWHEPSAAHTAPNRAQGWHVAFSATGVQAAPQAPAQGEGWS